MSIKQTLENFGNVLGLFYDRKRGTACVMTLNDALRQIFEDSYSNISDEECQKVQQFLENEKRR